MSRRVLPNMLGNERGSWSLIGLLISLVIGMVVLYLVIGPQLKSGMGAKTIPGRAMEKGHEVECQSNLRSIRAGIDMYRTEHQTLPASMADIDVGTRDPNFFKCPVGHEDYVYDPQTGTIHCPHPGHEKF